MKDIHKEITVLIGSCGGLTGLYVSKHLFKETNLLGFDNSPDCATKKYIKTIIKSPPYKDEDSFLSFFIEICQKFNVDIYIPTYSEEVRIISKNREQINSKVNTKFLVSDSEAILELENKKMAYERLKTIGVDTPKIVKIGKDKIYFPIYAKPNRASGSKNNFVVSSIEQLEYLKKFYPDLIYLEYLNGIEFTVDLFFTKEGKLHDYNQRERLKTNGGAAIITRNRFDVLIEDYIEIIRSCYHIEGPANIQFFFTENGRRVVTDINLRMPSGGLPLSVKSGLDIPKMIINECLGLSIKNFRSDRKIRTMYRYYEEYFE